MNILVVNPPNNPFTNKSILAEPIDVLQIATIVKQKHQNVKVIDMDVNSMDNTINNYLEEKNIIIFVYDYQLPLHTSETIQNIFEIVKNTDKQSKFIIIGKTSSYYHEKFLNSGIDVVIKGIAENIINDVIECIFDKEKLLNIPNIVIKDNGNIISTKEKRIINNFKQLPYPNRELLDISKYMDTRTIVTSRGCTGKCSFCTTPTFFGNWSGKSALQIIEEIEYLIKVYKTTKIIFLDDNMTINKNRMIELCKYIKLRNIKCLFGCLSSINYYDKEMFEIMYNAGFRWVHFGIESGSEKVLKLMNKNMDIKTIKQVINEVKQIGFRVRTSIILDYPKSTKEDIIKTKELILELMPHEIRLHYLAYRVGTKVFEQNKSVKNKTQYIHNNKPNVENEKLTNEINSLIKEIEKNDYYLIFNDTDWNKYNTLSKDAKFASFIPIKYGLCWYE